MAEMAQGKAIPNRIQAVVGWMALALVLVSALPLGANRPGAWTLLGLVVLILFAVQVIVDMRRPAAAARGRAWPLVLGWLAVLGWAMVQVHLPVPAGLAHPYWALAPGGGLSRIGADPGAGQHAILRLATYGLVAWIIAAASLNSKRAWAFTYAIALFSSALAVFGLFAAFTGYNPLLDETIDRRRIVSASFINRNSYATYAVFGLLANVAAYIHLSGKGTPGGDAKAELRNFLEGFFGGAWLFALGVLFCGAALAMTGSRAGSVAGLVGVAVMALALRGRGGSQPLLWGVLLAAVGFAVLTLGSETIRRFLSDTSEQLRFSVYREILTQIMERPLLGHGIGAFQDTFRAHVPEGAAIAEWDKAHNSFLENAYELGLPAAALFYVVLAGILLRLLAGLRQRRQDAELPAMALAALVAGGFHAAFDFSLQIPAIALLLATMIGIGWSQSFQRQERAMPEPSRRGPAA